MLHSIGGRRIGQDAPLFVVAELGLNHGGSVARALELVDAAAEGGASAIKLQSLTADRLVSAGAPPPSHLADPKQPSQLIDFFRRFELDESAHRAIVSRARVLGLAVLATPFSLEAVDMLDAIGIDAFKIASGDLTYTSLIERAGRTGRPLVLSTGMSDLQEVAHAVDLARAAEVRELGVLHCVSCYPVPAGHENLGAIAALIRTFRLPVGLSDHGRDPIAAALAVALGATMYERHLVLEDDRESVDRPVSSTPQELGEIVRLAERARQALGEGHKVCLPIETANRMASRRSLRAVRALRVGDRIGADDIIALRPADGLDCTYQQALVGVRLAREVGKHEPFVLDDIPGLVRKASHVV